MRLHVLQHVPFEDAANIAVWAAARGHALATTRLFAGETPPDPAAYDALVLMGGPMNIYDCDRHPWLAAERRHIEAALATGRGLLGVCLGAQLIADVLGGAVTRNATAEIGWYEVTLTPAGRAHPCFAGFEPTFVAFHWHGDTFAIPPGADLLAASDRCPHQAFGYGPTVLALQFHLDYAAESIAAMLAHCGHELDGAPGVQSPEQIAGQMHRVATLQQQLETLLDAWACRVSASSAR